MILPFIVHLLHVILAACNITWDRYIFTILLDIVNKQVQIQRGEDRPEGLDPPGKSQVIWVSIENKQLDPPPPPGKSWTPPPLENVGPPLEP